MSLEVLKDIRKAEHNAEKRQAAAEKKAQKIISEAEAKARDILNEAEEQLKKRRNTQEEKLDTMFSQERRHAEEKTTKELKGIQKQAHQNKDQAVAIILKEFFT